MAIVLSKCVIELISQFQFHILSVFVNTYVNEAYWLIYASIN